MKRAKTLIFAGAHPDDETFGVGGTLAQHAAAGVKVYYVCGTRGEAGSVDPEQVRGYGSVGDLRWAELECAAKILGLAGVTHLGYRDSGMPGTEDNKHPLALMHQPLDEVTGRIVKVIRELKPEVVITFDPIGGYRHPDHIAMHNATVRAFYAAGDVKQYPEAGPAFQASKLYFHVFQRGLMKLAVRLMPLLGQDPHHFGRNKDIDIASIMLTEFPIHAIVRLNKEAVEAREKASACHASQLGGRPRGMGLFNLASRLSGPRDTFMRAYPPPGKKRETDLFAGVY